MIRITVLAALTAGLLLSGCQSARFAPALPRVSEYNVIRSRPVTILSSPDGPANEPVLSAALPEQTSGSGASPKAVPVVRAQSARVFSRPTVLPAPPDTTLPRPLRPDPVIPADPLTTAVNVGGGITAAAGLAVLVATTLTDKDASLGAQGIEVLAGLALLGAGAALLFFQGKNGRLRKIREARRQANEPSLVTSASPTARAPFRPGLRKAARILILVGAALFLLGLLVPYGIYFAAAPALALILVGVFMLVFSI